MWLVYLCCFENPVVEMLPQRGDLHLIGGGVLVQ